MSSGMADMKSLVEMFACDVIRNVFARQNGKTESEKQNQRKTNKQTPHKQTSKQHHQQPNTDRRSSEPKQLEAAVMAF